MCVTAMGVILLLLLLGLLGFLTLGIFYYGFFAEEIKRIGYLNYSEIRRLITEHLRGYWNHENKLWALINLVCWHRSADTCV